MGFGEDTLLIYHVIVILGGPPSNFSFKSLFWLYFFVIRILSELELNYCCCSYLLPDEVTKPYWANW